MRIRIDPSLRVPVSEQLAAALRSRIERGTLAHGARVPPVRELALELGLAANTVAKAYRALEAEGLLVGRGRRGTFVAEARGGASARAALDRAAERYADRALGLGFATAEAREALERALRRR